MASPTVITAGRGHLWTWSWYTLLLVILPADIAGLSRGIVWIGYPNASRQRAGIITRHLCHQYRRRHRTDGTIWRAVHHQHRARREAGAANRDLPQVLVLAGIP